MISVAVGIFRDGIFHIIIELEHLDGAVGFLPDSHPKGPDGVAGLDDQRAFFTGNHSRVKDCHVLRGWPRAVQREDVYLGLGPSTHPRGGGRVDARCTE